MHHCKNNFHCFFLFLWTLIVFNWTKTQLIKNTAITQILIWESNLALAVSYNFAFFFLFTVKMFYNNSFIWSIKCALMSCNHSISWVASSLSYSIGFFSKQCANLQLPHWSYPLKTENRTSILPPAKLRNLKNCLLEKCLSGY